MILVDDLIQADNNVHQYFLKLIFLLYFFEIYFVNLFLVPEKKSQKVKIKVKKIKSLTNIL